MNANYQEDAYNSILKRNTSIIFLFFCRFSAIKSFDDIGSGNYQIVLNEGVMKGIDFVVDQARFYGLKVILVLTDYFADRAGGPIQFME